MDDVVEKLYYSGNLELFPKGPRLAEKSLKSVPRFTLYGEGAEAADDEFVHIERIEARSARYGWRIGAHAHHGLFQAVVILAGGAEVRFDESELRLEGPVTVTLPAAAVHSFHFDPGTDGQVLTVAERLLFAAARDGGAEAAALFTRLLTAPAWHVLRDPDRLAPLLAAIEDEFAGAGSGRTPALDWLVRAALLLIGRELAPAETADRPRWESFNRFRALMEEHFLEHWPITRYADALGLTETTLDRLCRAVAGRSAFQLVQQRLLLEARRKLVYIALPVASIAYELGFADPGYFSRFFRRHTGHSPAAWRQMRLS
jgi:AraC family transcriptional activator of pobA